MLTEGGSDEPALRVGKTGRMPARFERKASL